jgi:Tol biopolymer transport system component
VACSSEPSRTQSEAAPWKAPPVRWVSDLGPFEQRFTYNEASSVSNGGRWVVFSSHVKERPSRVFLVDTKRRAVSQIDASFDGRPRKSPGVRRYHISLSLPDPEITPDGRYVIFSSPFSNIVPGDRNRATDVFVHDRVGETTRIVSRSSDGMLANGNSFDPAISADGRYVVFASRASNLSPRDGDREHDVYLRDLRTGKTELISVGRLGKGDDRSGYPDVSDDGDRVSFISGATNLVRDDANELTDLFVRERSTKTTIRASVGTAGEEPEAFEECESGGCYRVGGAREPSISGDGEVVVFVTDANGLVSDDRNYNPDVYIHEIVTGVTERVSISGDGSDAYGPGSVECGKDPVCSQFTSTHSPSISRDGNLVYFISAAPEISDEDDDGDKGRGSGAQVFVHDRTSGHTLIVSRYRDGSPVESSNWYPGEISSDGLLVTYSCNSIKLDGPRGDQDPGPDVFLQRLPMIRGVER